VLLGPEPERVRGLEPERVRGLGQARGLEQARGPVRHKPQLTTRSLVSLPLAAQLSFFFSFSPPKILKPGLVKIFPVESYHPLYQ